MISGLILRFWENQGFLDQERHNIASNHHIPFDISFLGSLPFCFNFPEKRKNEQHESKIEIKRKCKRYNEAK